MSVDFISAVESSNLTYSGSLSLTFLHDAKVIQSRPKRFTLRMASITPPA
jgi:hypothetical protein